MSGVIYHISCIGAHTTYLTLVAVCRFKSPWCLCLHLLYHTIQATWNIKIEHR